MSAASIPLDMMFEPTGILLKDYNAYCEVDGLLERDDLIDAVEYVPVADPISGAKKLRTRLVLRNPVRSLLPQPHFQPMAKAIPHCSTLDVIQLTGCGVTDLSIRNLAEAVYRSPSITSVTIDFNSSSSTVGLSPEPKPRDDRTLITDINVTGIMFRNGILTGLEEAQQKKDEKGAKRSNVAAQPVGAKAKAQAAREAEEQERASQLIPIPEGWAALCFSGIQHLCLRGNKINDGDVILMARHLEEPYSDLRCLNLWGNDISDVGAKEIANAVATSRRLTALDLGQNKIGDGGLEAWAKLFLTSDVTLDEAMRLRTRTLTVLNTNGPIAPVNPPVFDPLPPMPSFAEIFAAYAEEASLDNSPGSVGGDRAAASGSSAPGRGSIGSRGKIVRGGSGGASRDASQQARAAAGAARRGADQFSLSDRSRSDFDRDLVRCEDGRIRVPGCIQITSLNFAHNPLITDKGVLALERVLKTQEPMRAEDAGSSSSGGGPAHYCSTLALQRLEVSNSNLSDQAMNKLAAVMQKVVTRRTVAQSG